MATPAEIRQKQKAYECRAECNFGRTAKGGAGGAGGAGGGTQGGGAGPHGAIGFYQRGGGRNVIRRGSLVVDSRKSTGRFSHMIKAHGYQAPEGKFRERQLVRVRKTCYIMMAPRILRHRYDKAFIEAEFEKAQEKKQETSVNLLDYVQQAPYQPELYPRQEEEYAKRASSVSNRNCMRGSSRDGERRECDRTCSTCETCSKDDVRLTRGSSVRGSKRRSSSSRSGNPRNLSETDSTAYPTSYRKSATVLEGSASPRQRDDANSRQGRRTEGDTNQKGEEVELLYTEYSEPAQPMPTSWKSLYDREDFVYWKPKPCVRRKPACVLCDENNNRIKMKPDYVLGTNGFSGKFKHWRTGSSKRKA